METLTRAIVEKDRMANRIPDRRKLHRTRTSKREVESAWFAVSFDNHFVELEGTDHELLLLANRSFHECTQIIES